MSHRVDGRFTPKKSEERITLFTEPPEPLPIAARVFTRDHADVTGQCFPIGKTRGIAHKYFRR
jgi:hypothetical protein